MKKTGGKKAGRDASGSTKGGGRIVRDSYTIPSKEHKRLKDIQERCLNHAVHVYKSEILRAGLKVLDSLPDDQLLNVLKNISRLKSGRPKAAVGKKKASK